MLASINIHISPVLYIRYIAMAQNPVSRLSEICHQGNEGIGVKVLALHPNLTFFSQKKSPINKILPVFCPIKPLP